MEVGHRDIVTLNGHRSWHAQPGDHLVDVVALKVIVQQPALGLMVAITDQQSGWIVAGVEGHAVGGVELLEAIPLRAKVRQILSLRAEAKDSVTGIAVREVDLAIGGYGDGGWRPLFDFDTALFLGRDAQLEDDRPGLSLNLDALASGISGSVEKVTAVLSADLHVVQAGVVVAEMPPREHTVRREDEDAQIRTGVDLTLAVDDDTAVGWADLRLAGSIKPPAWHGIKRHDAAAHPNRLSGESRRNNQPQHKPDTAQHLQRHRQNSLEGKQPATRPESSFYSTDTDKFPRGFQLRTRMGSDCRQLELPVLEGGFFLTRSSISWINAWTAG